jgi:hypothetical protein
MIEKLIKWIVFLLLSSFTMLAQNTAPNLLLVKTLDVQAQLISSDKLGNLYAISNHEILKYDANGKLLQKNSIKSLGNIYTLDVSNPMKILAFYKDYNKIVFLDNMLAASENSIDLSSIGFDQVTLSCTSHDNGIWVYNSLNFELVRMEPTLKISHQSGNISQLIGSAIKPLALVENNNRVYLCDSIQGVLVFDIFGTYIKSIPLFKVKDFQVENNMMYFLDNSGFGSFNLDLIQQQKMDIPEPEVQQIRLQKNRVFFRLKDNIKIYSN